MDKQKSGRTMQLTLKGKKERREKFPPNSVQATKIPGAELYCYGCATTASCWEQGIPADNYR